MADPITDDRLRCTANLSFRLHDDEVRAIAAELLAARAEVERLRAELRAVATIAHEGGLAELGEGPPLTAIRRRTLCWWDRTGSRADAYARVRAAMKHKETP